MTPASVSKGFMTPDMMVVTDLDGTLVSGAPGRKPSSEILMHLVAYRERPDVGAVVHAHPPLVDRLRGGGHPARSRRARRGRDDARQHSDRGVRHAVDDASWPTTVAPYVKAHDGLLLANHGALALGADLFARVLQDGDDRALRAASAWSRGMLGREHLLSREEVDRLQGLRGRYGIAAPAPICPDPSPARRRRSDLSGHRRAVVTGRAARARHERRSRAPRPP